MIRESVTTILNVMLAVLYVAGGAAFILFAYQFPFRPDAILSERTGYFALGVYLMVTGFFGEPYLCIEKFFSPE
jgi:hypothetical protein